MNPDQRKALRTEADQRDPNTTIPPAPQVVGALLSEYCSSVGITCLEVFGSTSRGEAVPGADVDLLATFATNPGIKFFAMEEEMAEILGVPVHLMTRESVEQTSNPYRRASILNDARVVYRR
jgi:predicted nucleotidyltransferase